MITAGPNAGIKAWPQPTVPEWFPKRSVALLSDFSQRTTWNKLHSGWEFPDLVHLPSIKCETPTHSCWWWLWWSNMELFRAFHLFSMLPCTAALWVLNTCTSSIFARFYTWRAILWDVQYVFHSSTYSRTLNGSRELHVLLHDRNQWDMWSVDD